MTWLTRAAVKQLALHLENPVLVMPLSPETVAALLTERNETARQLKTGTKNIPSHHLQEARKSTLNLLQQALSPQTFPNPKQIADAVILGQELVSKERAKT